MKKIFTVLAAALMISVSASAQHEIGGIVGGMYGASYKYWFNDNVALQADLAVGLTEGSGAYYTRVNGTSYHSANFHTGMYDFTINPNALYHFELPANFKLYVGGGVGFGLVNFLDGGDDKTVMGKFGLNAAVGATYDFDNVPLVLAFDFRPGYGLGFGNDALKYGIGGDGPHLSYFDWKIAFAVRYKL